MIQIRGDVDHIFYSKIIDQIIKKLKIKSLAEDPSNEIIILFSKANRKIMGDCDGISKKKIKISIYTKSHKKRCTAKKNYDEEILDTLAHEFVHAKQYLKGELESLPGCFKYKSKKYPSTQPWEEEAYAKAARISKKIK